jgi:hypothetical protein
MATGRAHCFEAVATIHSRGKEELAVQTFNDVDSPRHRLSFADLPRGLVAFPPHIIEGVTRRRDELHYGDDYFRDSLEQHTLSWFYDGLPVAYRSIDGGIEVIALGFEEVAAYQRHPQAGVRVVQPG